MMLSMVMGLILTWLPMNLINLWRDFDNSENSSSWFSLIFALCHVSAMTSTVWNPIIYSWFNPQFSTILRSIRKNKQIQICINSFEGISRSSKGTSATKKALFSKKTDKSATNNNRDIVELVNNGKDLILP